MRTTPPPAPPRTSGRDDFRRPVSTGREIAGIRVEDVRAARILVELLRCGSASTFKIRSRSSGETPSRSASAHVAHAISSPTRNAFFASKSVPVRRTAHLLQ